MGKTLPAVDPIPTYDEDSRPTQADLEHLFYSPRKWLEKGSELWHVVRMALKAIDDGYVMETGRVGTSGWRNVGAAAGMTDNNIAQMTMPIVMLYASAVECWLKGLVVARYKFNGEDLPKKELTHHDLVKLAEMSHVSNHLEAVDLDYLVFLENISAGFGRFTTPKSLEQMAPVLDYSLDEDGRIDEWNNIALDPDRQLRIETAVTAVYDELHEAIYQ